MASTKYFILAAALIVLVKGAPTDEPKHEIKCQGSPVKMNDRLIKAQEKCFSKYNQGATSDEIKKNRGGPKNETCMAVCMMQEVGLMSDDYKFVTSKLTELAKSVSLAEKAVPSVVEAVTTCINDKGSNMEIKEGSCDGILPVFACIGPSLKKICEA